MSKKISVVIPIYNVEEYLDECLQSVEKQTISDQLEVILVDDGSTDQCGEIAKQGGKAKGWSYYHKENGGLSSARNYGMEKASGDYIYFLDSDDFLADDAMEIAFRESARYQLDVLRFSAYTFIDHEKEYQWNINGYKFRGSYKEIYDSEQLLENIIKYHDTDLVSTWALFLKRSFLRENNIVFLKGIKYEDNLFQLECFMCAAKIKILNLPLYYRRYRNGSIIQTALDKDLLKAMGETLIAAEKRYSNSTYSSKVELYLHDYAWKYAGAWSRIPMHDKLENRELSRNIKSVLRRYRCWNDRKLKLFLHCDILFQLRQDVREIVVGDD